jgi:hypothetical protein
MRCLVLLLLLLAAVPSPADDPGHNALRSDTERIIEFATLTPAQAARLAGHRCVFQIDVRPSNSIQRVFNLDVFYCSQSNRDLLYYVGVPCSSKVKRGARLIVEGVVEVVRVPAGEVAGLCLLADRVR